LLYFFYFNKLKYKDKNVSKKNIKVKSSNERTIKSKGIVGGERRGGGGGIRVKELQERRYC